MIWYYTIYYNIIYYNIILYYIILYYIVLYCIMLSYFLIISYHIVLYYSTLYHIILYYIIVCYVILYYVMLYYIIIYYIIFYSILLYYIVVPHLWRPLFTRERGNGVGSAGVLRRRVSSLVSSVCIYIYMYMYMYIYIYIYICIHAYIHNSLVSCTVFWKIRLSCEAHVWCCDFVQSVKTFTGYPNCTWFRGEILMATRKIFLGFYILERLDAELRAPHHSLWICRQRLVFEHLLTKSCQLQHSSAYANTELGISIHWKQIAHASRCQTVSSRVGYLP